MSSKQCLNCGNELSNKFCCQCGQKADTHRITVRHFIEHDLLHGVFHIEKGILFTVKETFTRPGKAAMDYINGKRISYYNIFYLLLLLVGFNLLVMHYIKEFSDTAGVLKADKDGVKILNFINANIKYLILSFIPLFAFNGWLMFRRLRLNIAEHHIVSGFVLLGCALIALVYNLLLLLPVSWQDGGFVYLELALTVFLFLFPVYVYYMAFGPQYKIAGFTFRMMAMYALFSIEMLILLLIAIVLISKGSFDGALELA